MGCFTKDSLRRVGDVISVTGDGIIAISRMDMTRDAVKQEGSVPEAIGSIGNCFLIKDTNLHSLAVGRSIQLLRKDSVVSDVNMSRMIWGWC